MALTVGLLEVISYGCQVSECATASVVNNGEIFEVDGHEEIELVGRSSAIAP